MNVNAPSLDNVVDKEATAGDEVTLTLTPPAAGDYDHCQILYAEVGATAWTNGPTYTGAQGVQDTQDVTGLTPGAFYEFAVYALDGSANAGPPSRPRRAIPTTGAGPVSLQIVNDIKAAIETITEAGGHFADIGTVFTDYVPEDTAAETGLFCVLRTETIRHDQEATEGDSALSDSYLSAVVAMCRKGRARGATEWEKDSAHKMIAAATLAIMEDFTRGGHAVDTIEQVDTTTVQGLAELAEVVSFNQFEIHYTTDRQNPYREML